MKLNKMVDPAFQAALRKLAAQEVPLKTAFKLRGTIKQVNEALAKYDEVRTDALKRYGDKDENNELVVEGPNSAVKLSEDNAQLFVKELNDLLDSEIEVSTIKAADLGDKPSLSTSELFLLEDIVVD